MTMPLSLKDPLGFWPSFLKANGAPHLPGQGRTRLDYGSFPLPQVDDVLFLQHRGHEFVIAEHAAQAGALHSGPGRRTGPATLGRRCGPGSRTPRPGAETPRRNGDRYRAIHPYRNGPRSPDRHIPGVRDGTETAYPALAYPFFFIGGENTAGGKTYPLWRPECKRLPGTGEAFLEQPPSALPWRTKSSIIVFMHLTALSSPRSRTIGVDMPPPARDDKEELLKELTALRLSNERYALAVTAAKVGVGRLGYPRRLLHHRPGSHAFARL